MSPSGSLIAILPCNDLDASERFYNRLGFARTDSQRPAPGEPDTYRMLSNSKGGYLHLTDAVEGWLTPGRNPFGLYLCLESVDAAAREFRQSPAGSTDRRNTFCELLSWGLIEQGFSWPFIELPCDRAELGLAIQGQIDATRKILAQQSVGVFA